MSGRIGSAARPLQARIEELEADVVSVLSESGDVIRENQRKLDEIVALHADKDALQARVEVLTAALTKMVFQFGGHFVGVASQEAALANARAALAAK